MEQRVKGTEDKVRSGLWTEVAGGGRVEGWASVNCEGWGTGTVSWAGRQSQGPWVRGRAWEGGSVQDIGFGAASLLGRRVGQLARVLGTLRREGPPQAWTPGPSPALP